MPLTYDFDQCRGLLAGWMVGWLNGWLGGWMAGQSQSIGSLPHLCPSESHLGPQFGTAVIWGYISQLIYRRGRGLAQQIFKLNFLRSNQGAL